MIVRKVSKAKDYLNHFYIAVATALVEVYRLLGTIPGKIYPTIILFFSA
jgi:hypothetical protein